MDFPQFFPTKRTDDVEDMALSFVEGELGRHDWQNNWKTAKAQGTAMPRLEAWLRVMDSGAASTEVYAYLDKLVDSRSGRWL